MKIDSYSRVKPKIFISEPYVLSSKPPLGEVLHKAGLVSETQILLALQKQRQDNDLRIGKILALQGWISAKTADFFVEQWPILLTQNSRQLLGYYLKEAGLLNEEQINSILSEQGRLWLRFGALAVLKGWLKETTLNFFLCHLFPDAHSKSARRDKLNNFNLSANQAQKQSPTKKTETPVVLPVSNNTKLPQRYAGEAEENLEEIIWID